MVAKQMAGPLAHIQFLVWRARLKAKDNGLQIHAAHGLFTERQTPDMLYLWALVRTPEMGATVAHPDVCPQAPVTAQDRRKQAGTDGRGKRCEASVPVLSGMTCYASVL